ncbi:DUF5675 family protein [Chryseobacterium caseinilyticum]|uniref:DUF5675 domain-containing protein n=1 Tax=Chryseobacterium caseinilyticum TaxID=2771428 RepID=A0ABR8ZH00_9FLAO|nr:DUF5675 family protein [Chryseobacterium caseinilyticum]MBD8084555.1 hypothetical protein [Chryseobacterium caseinilyticum]
MELILFRKYHPEGTNGQLFVDGDHLCFTIELPWRNNRRRVSCIPEGTYRLVKRFSKRFSWHLMLENVRGRSLILIHPANNAVEELSGCIAPVTAIAGHGKGYSSKKAFAALKFLVFPILNDSKEVTLKVTS